jgi:hypothetical protein
VEPAPLAKVARRPPPAEMAERERMVEYMYVHGETPEAMQVELSKKFGPVTRLAVDALLLKIREKIVGDFRAQQGEEGRALQVARLKSHVVQLIKGKKHSQLAPIERLIMEIAGTAAPKRISISTHSAVTVAVATILGNQDEDTLNALADGRDVILADGEEATMAGPEEAGEEAE